nr:MAG TPA: Phosphoribosyl-aminoimidazole carboxylase [Caudoviricetes sp.]
MYSHLSAPPSRKNKKMGHIKSCLYFYKLLLIYPIYFN